MNRAQSSSCGKPAVRVALRTNRGEVTVGSTMSSVITDLYAAISVLDSENQSDLAGRLHALTLEIRERAATGQARQYS